MQESKRKGRRGGKETHRKTMSRRKEQESSTSVLVALLCNEPKSVKGGLFMSELLDRAEYNIPNGPIPQLTSWFDTWLGPYFLGTRAFW